MPPSQSPDLLDCLRLDYGEELVGLNEFADLLGFNASMGAQLRHARNRDPQFPAAVHSSARAIVHPLSDLLVWLEQSRFNEHVALQPPNVWRWRLERSAERAAKSSDRLRVRNLVAGIALARDAVEYGDLFTSGPASVAAILDRAKSLPAASGRPYGTLEIDPPMATDPRAMDELLSGVSTPDANPDIAAIVGDVDGLWSACEHSGEPHTYAAQIDHVLLVLAFDRATRPNRASRAVGQLLAIALDANPGDVVYEPTCGECEALLRVALLGREIAGSTESSTAVAQPKAGVVVIGRDVDADAVRIGRARLALHYVASSLRVSELASTSQLDVSPLNADRIVVDPGPTKVDEVLEWLRGVDHHLSTTGRAVVALAVSTLSPRLLSELPPQRLIVLPRGVAHAGSEATVLWVFDRTDATDDRCDIIDLRLTNGVGGLPDRVRAFADAVAHSQSDAVASSTTLQEALGALLPDKPHVMTLTRRELAGRLSQLVDGPLRPELQAGMLADNRRWALQLASEMERLITTPTTTTSQPNLAGTPPESPPGVLAHLASDEARRILRRLADSFDDTSTTRRGRPRKHA